MAVPEDVIDQAIEEGDTTYKVVCPECQDYTRQWEKEEKPYVEVKRQFASHYSQRHMQGGGGSSTSNNDNQGNQTQSSQQQSSQAPSTNINERDLIYEKGTEGLDEIKQERLKEWLRATDGVGGQTEQRIMMLFQRNSVYRENPNALYAMLDDQIGASPSYINTLVQDVFAPEREYEDLLSNQGFQPWFRRGDIANSGGGGHQPQGGGQQLQMQGPNGQPGGQGMPQQQGDRPLTREEAETLITTALKQSTEGRGKLRQGLDEATESAVRNMADNVGGLAGTIQKILDESLVEYARRNPEWVVENIDIIEKFLGTADEAGTPPPPSEHDRRVDEAIEDVEEGFRPSQETKDLVDEVRDSDTEQTEHIDTAQDMSYESEATTDGGSGLESFEGGPQQEEIVEESPEEQSTEQNETVQEGVQQEEEKDEWDDIFGDMEDD